MARYPIALIPLLLLLQWSPKTTAVRHVVPILRGDQIRTSTTLVWDSYTGKDFNLNEGVEAGVFRVNAEDQYKMYVCRVNDYGIMIIGQTIKNENGDWECALAVAGNHLQNNREFEVLVNKNKLAKLNWTKWGKFWSAEIPDGAVTEKNIGRADSNYVARHKAETIEGGSGLDYLVGRLDPNNKLGRVCVVEDNVDKVSSLADLSRF